MRLRVVIVLVGLTIASLVGAIFWSGRSGYDPAAGPIDSSENGLATSAPIDVGRDISIGITSLFNDGKKPVTVERVRLLGVTGALELVGVGTRLFPEGDVGAFVSDFGFPPERYPTRPLTEQNVLPVAKLFNPNTGEPNDGLQLVIGVRATAPGIAAYRAVDVRYRVGSRRYREVFEANAVHLCAPLAEYADPVSYRTIQDCPPRDQKDHFEDRVLEWPPSGDASR